MNKFLSGRRILVVEDEMLILLMLEHLLVDLGCESVTSAATIDNAIDLIHTQSFDAAMLDMNMGGEESQPVAEALIAKKVPFFYCTGNGGNEMNNGYAGQAVLRKPFRFADFVDAFARVLSIDTTAKPHSGITSL